jgi:alpha-maltose-1-phosphate synthase
MNVHRRPRVVLAAWGKFHHFDLARQLERFGMLTAICTTYPRFKLRNEGIPQSKILCRSRWHAPLLALWRYGAGLGPLEAWWQRRVDADFVSWLPKRLPECDALIALSGSGLKGGHEMRRRGGLYICDRGSSHIRRGEEILREEFHRWDQPYAPTDPVFITKEESEYALADAISVPSGFAKQSFVEMGVPADRVRVIPLGVEHERFRKVASPPADEFRVLYVGQGSFRKGLPYLLEGFERLRHPRKRLRVIGALRPEMKRWLYGRHFAGVEFVGVLPQEKLMRHMSESHVHVLASVEDGFGMVVTQSMACGCPQIVTSNCGASDIITDGREGFIVPIRDGVLIGERLQLLASKPALRQQMGAAAVERVRLLGGWDAYGREWVTFLEELRQRKIKCAR